MSIDYRTLLVEQTPEGDDYRTAERILATRIPDLCSDCNEHGMRWMGRVTDDGDGPWVHCTHLKAPTIADLLRWGENVAKAEEMPDPHMVYGPWADGWNACLVALRTEADR